LALHTLNRSRKYYPLHNFGELASCYYNHYPLSYLTKNNL
jgi:hypothetical protein